MLRRLLAPGLAFLLLLAVTDARAAGLLVPRDGSTPIGVKSHRVTAVVEDGLAKTTLRQTFVNHHPRALEAIYVFPIPENASLVDVAMEVGGQRLEGLLVERRRARKIYDDIVREKRDPALVEQIGRSTFRLSVFPVLPKVETIVELTWIERVPLSQGVFRYVYPLALTRGSATTEQDLTFHLTLRSSVPIGEVTSGNTGMEIVRKGPGEFVASMERIRIALNEDISVAARVEVGKPTVTVTTYRRKGEEAGWFLALVTPPKATAGQLLPRDIVLVIDTSGSMRGAKIVQAKVAARYLLSHLRLTDRVNVIRFSSTIEAFTKDPKPATPSHLAALRKFVEGFRAEGGTALGDALRDALDTAPAEGRVRTLVLLTDGRPTLGVVEPERIVRFARDGAGTGFRIFPFGVGSDLDSALLEGIARAGNGRAEIFRPKEEIAPRLTAFLDRTASPVIADIQIEIDDLKILAIFPRTIPDGYLGEQVFVAGRYRGGGEKTVRVSGLLGGRRAEVTTVGDFRTEPGGSAFARWLYARERLEYLAAAHRLRTGLGDEAYYAALDRGAYETEGEIVSEIISVSMRSGVQCAHTSFLVLLPEDRQRIDPLDADAVAKAMDRVRERKAALSPSGQAPPEAGPAGPPVDLPDTDELEISGGLFGARGGKRAVPAAPRNPTDPQPPGESSDGGGPDGGVAATPPAAGAGTVDGGGDDGGGGGHPGGPAMPPPGMKKPSWKVPAWLERKVKVYVRRGAPKSEREKASKPPEYAGAIDLGLGWLARQQTLTGRWKSEIEGRAGNDVGVTGLALLAFLGRGETMFTAEHGTTVLSGLKWLLAMQDGQGFFGTRDINSPRLTASQTYGHAIAAQAMAEAYGMTGSVFLKLSAQRGLDFIAKMQNPYLAWRYGIRPQDNDTSVTVWMVSALTSGREAGLKTSRDGFDGARAWLEKVTEPEYGRAGYTARGTGPARDTGLNDKFPSDKTESLTAAAVFSRVLIGEDPRNSEVIQKGAELCMKCLPVWSRPAGTIDMYYWYWGTLAMHQVGGDAWTKWSETLSKQVADQQVKDGDKAGSWDPVGAWGHAGGRVYSTAILTLTLETYRRYPRIFEGRSTKRRKLR